MATATPRAPRHPGAQPRPLGSLRRHRGSPAARPHEADVLPSTWARYSSTDAVRKHCRKRHLEWLRKLDLVAAHDRYLPKPALYCRWGNEMGIS